MKLILFLEDTEAAELLEVASERELVSQAAYDKLMGAIATATSPDQFKRIFNHAGPQN